MNYLDHHITLFINTACLVSEIVITTLGIYMFTIWPLYLFFVIPAARFKVWLGFFDLKLMTFWFFYWWAQT